ncbi:conserved hypothetical protein [Leptospira interrogans serovar Manilae]|uniref:Uncharacterized protein n=1 Tax=Leptospira interrogans serovar Manilae TaxID=214675 RepID=A0AAQ1SNC6_LEPIR|nr:conserved hypothetical protein [Leptospira interrogans serovar Manilae]
MINSAPSILDVETISRSEWNFPGRFTLSVTILGVKLMLLIPGALRASRSHILIGSVSLILPFISSMAISQVEISETQMDWDGIFF